MDCFIFDHTSRTSFDHRSTNSCHHPRNHPGANKDLGFKKVNYFIDLK